MRQPGERMGRNGRPGGDVSGIALRTGASLPSCPEGATQHSQG